MMRVGLTGSIATGKSEVARCFREAGAAVFDSDQAVHDLYGEERVVRQVAALFPHAVSDGKIDRQVLGRHLASHPDQLPRLEALVHPLVRQRRLQFLETMATRPYAVLDIPLLYETGAETELDAVIVVTTTPALQHARALARKTMTPEKLDLILSHQLPMVEKAARADFVIETTGTLADLEDKVKQLIPRLEDMAKAYAS